MQIPILQQRRWLANIRRQQGRDASPSVWHLEDRHVVAVALACAVLMTVLLGLYMWIGQQSAGVRDRMSIVTELMMGAPGLLLAVIGAATGVWLKARNIDGSGAARIRTEDAATLSGKDRLTGLLNRRAFLTFVEDAFAYYQRYNRRIAVLMIEVDGRVAVDRPVDPETNDLVLGHVADVLDLTLRKTDKISRFNGDRFAVLLREITRDDAMMLARRMQSGVESLAVRCGERLIPVTISIGGALASRSDGDVEALLARADSALITAMSDGPSSICLQPGDEVPSADALPMRLSA